ncbi:MAG: hypothetical protein KA116_00085 [Proteobacteria bacterium]|nr:hypothetical protein [Pseudomonadota bacterium]
MKSTFSFLFLISFSAISGDISNPLRSFGAEVEKFNLRKENVEDESAPAPKDGEKAKTREILVAQDLDTKIREEFELLNLPEIEILDKLNLIDLRVIEVHEIEKITIPSIRKQFELQIQKSPKKDAEALDELRELADEKAPKSIQNPQSVHGEMTEEQRKTLEAMFNQMVESYSEAKLDELTSKQLAQSAMIQNSLKSKLSELKIRDIGISPNKIEVSQMANGMIVMKIPFAARLYYKAAGSIRPSGTSYLYGQIKLHSDLQIGCATDVQKCVPSNDKDKSSHAFFEVRARNYILGTDSEYLGNLTNIEVAIGSLVQFELASEIVSKLKSVSPQMATLMMQLLMSRDEGQLKAKKPLLENALKVFLEKQKANAEAAKKAVPQNIAPAK